MATCNVEFDKNPIVFSPGEKVTGNVKMQIPDEEFKARKVRMEMIGKAYTYWEGNVKNNHKINRAHFQINVKLLQRVTYTGFRDGFVNSQSHPCIGNEKEKVTYATRLNAQIRVEERKILEEIVEIKIEKNEKEDLEKPITVPPLPPSTKTCEIIDVEYFLKVKMSTLGTLKSVVKLELPFIIGTAPVDKGTVV
uniref:Arrestin_C domain-containing protein n=1 Tax=Caenorhabditis tropicalis TaxID=1561998 RepID=A0A1I7TA20_9PELO